MSGQAPRPDEIGKDTATKTPTEARQGVISGRVITVLLISVSLAVLAMVLSWVMFR